MSELKKCPIHKVPLQFEKWTAKSGKKAGQECRAYKCKVRGCNHIEWVGDNEPTTQPPQPAPQPPKDASEWSLRCNANTNATNMVNQAIQNAILTDLNEVRKYWEEVYNMMLNKMKE